MVGSNGLNVPATEHFQPFVRLAAEAGGGGVRFRGLCTKKGPKICSLYAISFSPSETFSLIPGGGGGAPPRGCRIQAQNH